ncbi:putative Zinc finger protein [Giardia muris]|uniref:Putative Zinc finger protein n=1 Tax=Giardia muris TaxID=5742 RepID=A0A4Z1SPR4_GIAMU|nr:putative Zinc finger protein [Giardia muris]|eukprot:TNJ26865.1 putative Zinc finger protein [Giardia muris]
MADFEEALEALRGVYGAAAVREVLEGPACRRGYRTVRVRVRAPEESRVDVDGFSVFVAVAEGRAPRAAVAGKALPASFAQALGSLVTARVADEGLVPALTALRDGYDAFLLRLWRHFERYQAFDGRATAVRYHLVEPAPEKPEPAPERPVSAAPVAPPEPDEPVEATAPAALATPAAPAYSKPTIDVRVGARATATARKFLAASDFRTLDEHYRRLYGDADGLPPALREGLRSGTTFFRVPGAAGTEAGTTATEAAAAAAVVAAAAAPLNRNPAWTEDDTAAFERVFGALNEGCGGDFLLTRQLLRLGRGFFACGFEVVSGTREKVVVRFNVPLGLLPPEAAEELGSTFPSVWQAVRGVREAHVPVLLNIRCDMRRHILVNVDPGGSFLRSVRAVASDELTAEAVVLLGKAISTALLRSPSLTLERAEGAHDAARTARLEALVDALPEPLSRLPVVDACASCPDLFACFHSVLPAALPTLLARCADVAEKRRVARVLRALGAAEDEPDGSDGGSDSGTDGPSGASDGPDASDESSDASVVDAASVIADVPQLVDGFAPAEARGRGLRMRLRGFVLHGAVLVQLARLSLSAVCTRCARVNVVALDRAGPGDENALVGACACVGCRAALRLAGDAPPFNEVSGAEPLLFEVHQACVPVGWAAPAAAAIRCLCGTCDAVSEHRRWRRFASPGTRLGSFCPMCFTRFELALADAEFVLPNGSTLPLPPSSSKAPLKAAGSGATSGAAGAALQRREPGPLPDNGACKHARHSHRWFRFECGLLFPCDTCHAQACSCGEAVARLQVCGFCGAEAAVGPTCPACKRDVVRRHSSHWEGGAGCRDRAAMSRKDARKYAGSELKTKSHRAERREASRR